MWKCNYGSWMNWFCVIAIFFYLLRWIHAMNIGVFNNKVIKVMCNTHTHFFLSSFLKSLSTSLSPALIKTQFIGDRQFLFLRGKEIYLMWGFYYSIQTIAVQLMKTHSQLVSKYRLIMWTKLHNNHLAPKTLTLIVVSENVGSDKSHLTPRHDQ